VTVPDGVRPGDSLLLFVTADPPGDLAGWRQLDRAGTTSVYHRVAGDGDAGAMVALPGATDGVLLVYTGTDGGDPEVTSASGPTTPAVDVTGPGAWTVSYWAGGPVGESAPAGVTTRGAVTGSLAGDSAGPVPEGRYGGLDPAPGESTAAFTVVVRPRR
jgi:hypothetical protein